MANGFKSFLSAFGKDFTKVFSFLGSSKGQAVVAGAEGVASAIAGAVAGPAGALAVSGVESLINSTLKQVIGVEAVAAAAGQQEGSGPQKAAAVISSITPEASNVLEAAGVSNATADQVQSFASVVNEAVVAILNAIPAPATT